MSFVKKIIPIGKYTRISKRIKEINDELSSIAKTLTEQGEKLMNLKKGASQFDVDAFARIAAAFKKRIDMLTDRRKTLISMKNKLTTYLAGASVATGIGSYKASKEIKKKRKEKK